MTKLVLIAFAAAVLSAPAAPAEKTVVLSVPSMNCAACPITVRKALPQAIVTFDDARATIDSLTKATANAGYPSTLKQ